MGLQDTLDELRKAQEANDQVETENEEEIEETPEPEEVEKDPETQEKPPEEEDKKAEKTPSEWRKERLEAKAAKDEQRVKEAEERARQAEQEVARLRRSDTPEEQITEAAPQIDPITQQIHEDYVYSKATKEFLALEEEIRREIPDYDDIANQYNRQLAWSIKMQNPHFNDAQCFEQAQKVVLNKAAGYATQGRHPAEELYNEAVSLGIRPTPKQEEVEENREIKPNMEKVSQNRSRNAGTAGAKGNGGSAVTTGQAAAQMTNAEWAKLPAEDKKRLLYGR